jgi:hypothetical protein
MPRDADTPKALGLGHAAQAKPMAPSPYWGEENLWDTRANNHTAMIDKNGRVWMAANVRGMENPAFLSEGLGSAFGRGVSARAAVSPGDDA